MPYTSMSTMRRMIRKPTNIMKPPIPIRMIARRDPQEVHRRVEHGLHEGRRDDEQEPDQGDRQEGHDVAGHPLLGGEGADLALDADPLADRVGDGVEDLGEVAAHLVLDRDGRDHQLQVLRADPADEVLQGLLERQAEVDLADHPGELRGDRRARLADDELDRLQERRAGPQRVRDEGDRVRELLVERVEPLALAPLDVPAGQEEADDGADEEEDRVLERRAGRSRRGT